MIRFSPLHLWHVWLPSSGCGIHGQLLATMPDGREVANASKVRDEPFASAIDKTHQQSVRWSVRTPHPLARELACSNLFWIAGTGIQRRQLDRYCTSAIRCRRMPIKFGLNAGSALIDHDRFCHSRPRLFFAWCLLRGVVLTRLRRWENRSHQRAPWGGRTPSPISHNFQRGVMAALRACLGQRKLACTQRLRRNGVRHAPGMRSNRRVHSTVTLEISTRFPGCRSSQLAHDAVVRVRRTFYRWVMYPCTRSPNVRLVQENGACARFPRYQASRIPTCGKSEFTVDARRAASCR